MEKGQKRIEIAENPGKSRREQDPRREKQKQQNKNKREKRREPTILFRQKD